MKRQAGKRRVGWWLVGEPAPGFVAESIPRRHRSTGWPFLVPLGQLNFKGSVLGLVVYLLVVSDCIGIGTSLHILTLGNKFKPDERRSYQRFTESVQVRGESHNLRLLQDSQIDFDASKDPQ